MLAEVLALWFWLSARSEAGQSGQERREGTSQRDDLAHACPCVARVIGNLLDSMWRWLPSSSGETDTGGGYRALNDDAENASGREPGVGRICAQEEASRLVGVEGKAARLVTQSKGQASDRMPQCQAPVRRSVSPQPPTRPRLLAPPSAAASHAKDLQTSMLRSIPSSCAHGCTDAMSCSAERASTDQRAGEGGSESGSKGGFLLEARRNLRRASQRNPPGRALMLPSPGQQPPEHWGAVNQPRRGVRVGDQPHECQQHHHHQQQQQSQQHHHHQQQESLALAEMRAADLEMGDQRHARPLQVPSLLISPPPSPPPPRPPPPRPPPSQSVKPPPSQSAATISGGPWLLRVSVSACTPRDTPRDGAEDELRVARVARVSLRAETMPAEQSAAQLLAAKPSAAPASTPAASTPAVDRSSGAFPSTASSLGLALSPVDLLLALCCGLSLLAVVLVPLEMRYLAPLLIDSPPQPPLAPPQPPSPPAQPSPPAASPTEGAGCPSLPAALVVWLVLNALIVCVMALACAAAVKIVTEQYPALLRPTLLLPSVLLPSVLLPPTTSSLGSGSLLPAQGDPAALHRVSIPRLAIPLALPMETWTPVAGEWGMDDADALGADPTLDPALFDA